MTIKNGSFQILSTENGREIQLFSVSSIKIDEEGNYSSTLFLNGTGNFDGTINALDGTIGGFTITNNGINSINRDFSLVLNNDGSSTLNASNLIIGDGAKIDNTITLGNFSIQNPDKNGKLVLVGKNNNQQTFSLTEDGIMKIGIDSNTITLDGKKSELRGNNWYITPDLASFSNASISGTLNTTVFNRETISAVGNSMLFVQSYNVKPIINYPKQNESKRMFLDLKDLTDKIPIGCYIYLTLQSDTEQKKIFHLLGRRIEENNEIEYQNIEVIYSDREDYSIFSKDENALIHILGEKDDTIFSISSGNSYSDNSQLGFLHKNALSLSKIGINGNFTKKLVLGDLSGVPYGDTNLGEAGYGLYCDNVYLNGQFVGSYTNNEGTTYYAGINGVGSAFSTKFKTPILFYAGAKTSKINNDIDIPFYVTTDGNLYANKGFFEGSIITNAEIEAASLTTAAIYPKEGEASLQIYDMRDNGTTGGISFCSIPQTIMETREYSSNEIMRISTSGFQLQGRSFISFEEKIGEKEISLDIDNLLVSDKGSLNIGKIRLSSEGLQYIEKQGETEVAANSFILGSDSFEIGEEFLYQNQVLQAKKNFIFEANVNLGRNVKLQQIKSLEEPYIQIGYDLYIGVDQQ